jgi:hypothetical protein
MKQEEL